MGEAPEGLSIDRIDVNGPYCKDNCRWVNLITQARNKTNTIFLEYKGVNTPLTGVVEILGMEYNKLYGLVKKAQKGKITSKDIEGIEDIDLRTALSAL